MSALKQETPRPVSTVVSQRVGTVCVFLAALIVGASNANAKDLVDIAQELRAAQEIETSCEKLKRLEGASSDLAKFIDQNSGTEVVAQLVTGQTVTGVNKFDLERELADFRQQVSTTAFEASRNLERDVTRLEREEVSKTGITELEDLVSRFEDLTRNYACVGLDLNSLGHRVTLIKVRNFVADESAGADALAVWKRNSLSDAIQLFDACARADALSVAIGEYEQLSNKFGQTTAFEEYAKGKGSEKRSFSSLIASVQDAQQRCGQKLAEEDEEVFAEIVDISRLRDQLENIQDPSRRAEVISRILAELERLIKQYPNSTVAGSFQTTGCFGPRLCLERLKYEGNQIVNKLASLETEAETELNRLRADSACGRNSDVSISGRIQCYQSALTRVDVIGRIYRDSKAWECLANLSECVPLRKESLTESLSILIETCDRSAKAVLDSAQRSRAELELPDLGAEQRVAVYQKLVGLSRELDNLQECANIPSDVVAEVGLDIASIREIEIKALEESALVEQLAAEFEDVQKTCARAMSAPVTRSDLPRLAECLDEIDAFAQKYPSSVQTTAIAQGEPIVPDVKWDGISVARNSEGMFGSAGSVEGLKATVVIKPLASWSTISNEMANALSHTPSIKVPQLVNGIMMDRFVVELGFVKVEHLEIPKVLSMIDPALEGRVIVLGGEALDHIDFDIRDGQLDMRLGQVIVGSEARIAISVERIKEKSEELLSGLVADLDERISKIRSSAEERLQNRESDDYSMLMEWFLESSDQVSQLNDQFEEVAEKRFKEITELKAYLSARTDELISSMEAEAARLCDSFITNLNTLESSEKLDDLDIAADEAAKVLIRLRKHYAEVDVVARTNNHASSCSTSVAEIQSDITHLSVFRKALGVFDQALATLISDERLEMLEEVLDLLEKISSAEEGISVANRVGRSDVIEGISLDIVEDLIVLEEDAKEWREEAEGLVEDARSEDRLPKRYDMLEKAVVLYEKLLDSRAAFDANLVLDLVENVRRELAALEKRLPVEPQTVRIVGGCFDIGGRENDEDVADDEKLSNICVDDFSIGIHEVTFHEYDRFVKALGGHSPDDMGWGRDYRPVINVSYLDIASYVEWISEQTGKTFRLPTEAEWEFAARAGESQIYPWGNNAGSNRANCLNCKSDWSGRQTAPVGSFQPNAWGLFDVAGNVAEKTCSVHREDFDGSEKQCASVEESGARVVRGGSWKSHSRNVRLSYRDTVDRIDQRSRFQGFRLVRED